MAARNDDSAPLLREANDASVPMRVIVVGHLIKVVLTRALFASSLLKSRKCYKAMRWTHRNPSLSVSFVFKLKQMPSEVECVQSGDEVHEVRH